ncbi:hypothetical protein AB1N83_007362 [Pleurotus pulmonarius]
MMGTGSSSNGTQAGCHRTVSTFSTASGVSSDYLEELLTCCYNVRGMLSLPGGKTLYWQRFHGGTSLILAATINTLLNVLHICLIGVVGQPNRKCQGRTATVMCTLGVQINTHFAPMRHDVGEGLDRILFGFAFASRDSLLPMGLTLLYQETL